MNIVINRVKVEINSEDLKISFFKDLSNDYKYIYARYKPSNLFKLINENVEIKKWLENLKKPRIRDEEYIYISFLNSSPEYHFQAKLSDLDNALKKKFIKELIIEKLKHKYIIEPFKEGADLCIYKPHEQNDNSVNNFKRYIRYDIVINIWEDKGYHIEFTIGIGSENTYIGKLNEEIKNKIENINKIKFLKNNLLVKLDEPNLDLEIKANYEIRKILSITPRPVRKFYESFYNLIKNFIVEISELLKDEIIIYQNLIKKDFKIVDFDKNKMIFKNDHVDYSTMNGMRDFGPYSIPDKAKDTKLLFIYPDMESASKLYTYLSRGYRHFPGIESYVGIPANLYEIKIPFSNLDNIVNNINNNLPDNKYENILAICIMPFSKTNATEEQSKIYYKIKEILLKKNIASQFIERNKIFMENFHFSLPNIAIAMLGKLGGIPWKLARSHYNQLTVGFNIFKKGKNSYLGSAVYFDNQGLIKKVAGFKSNSIDNISNLLIDSINEFKKEKKDANYNKVIIHYYKTISNDETNTINKTLERKLGQNFAFAVVEINDTKSTVDIAFDLEYQSLMPQSGVYVCLKPGEYLLFNNLRYWENPINPINQEELPIKIRIYDPQKSFKNEELISQVYEFSRLYWKSLKQKAQPVTIIYSKLIAEYIVHFENNQLPNSEIAKSTVWFI